MIFPRPVAAILLAAALPLAALGASGIRAKPTRPTSPDNATAFKGAIVTDAATGNVLFEDRADYSGPLASMTKLMTFAVVHDKLAAGTIKLDTPVRITAVDASMGGTGVYLDPRETFSVEELIYAMMIQSANDAAHALARAAAGSREAFVELMNAKAQQLGMTHTTFHTPHGLPPDNRRLSDTDTTTPRDYALLCRTLILKTDVLKYASVRNRDFAPERRKGAFKMENHNKLLDKVAGVDGLKTGFTKAAGYCTTVTAERNGRRVIVVIMGSTGPGGQLDLGRTRDLKAIELLERGFAALPAGSPAVPIINPASAAQPAPQAAPAASPISAAPIKQTEPTIKFSIPPKKK